MKVTRRAGCALGNAETFGAGATLYLLAAMLTIRVSLNRASGQCPKVLRNAEPSDVLWPRRYGADPGRRRSPIAAVLARNRPAAAATDRSPAREASAANWTCPSWPVQHLDRFCDDLVPGDAEHRETLVRVEVCEVCVARPLDELEDAQFARDRLVLLLRCAAEMRTAQLPLPGRLDLDRRDDDLRKRTTLPRHAVAPFGARITVIVRPSKLSRPCI